ncbi:MAG: MoaD/ThiS family protein [Fervidicoccaceae archaeon]|jgi:molybdopterin converting factor small subunit|nr:MoaD/ThiS family protein [Fervidicoccaceae archaeon]
MPIVKYIANLKTRVGVDQEKIEARTLREVISKVSEKVPDLVDFDGKTTGLYVILVNDVDHRLLGEEYILGDNDVITILPVIHGG